MPMDLIDFILNALPDNVMTTPYPGQNYGTTRDTVGDLLQAGPIEMHHWLEVEVLLSSKLLQYVSLDIPMNTHIPRKSVQKLLPIEVGAVVSPTLKKKMDEGCDS